MNRFFTAAAIAFCSFLIASAANGQIQVEVATSYELQDLSDIDTTVTDQLTFTG